MKIIIIPSCNKCPNRVWDYNNHACKAMDRVPIEGKKIPDWCPLADHPATQKGHQHNTFGPLGDNSKEMKGEHHGGI